VSTMRSFVVVVAVLALGCAIQADAFPQYLKRHRFAQVRTQDAPGPWVAPATTDQRSPCPVLNTLANHGAINHNGQGITSDNLVTAFEKILGCSKLFANAFAIAAFSRFNISGKTLDLGILTRPLESGGIEHLASLSRPDVRPWVQANPAPTPDVQRINTWLTAIGKKPLDASHDTDIISVSDMAKVRKTIEATDATAKAADKLVAAVEACLLLGIGHGDKGLTVGTVKSILAEEKFPPTFKINNYFLGFGFSDIAVCLAQMGIDKSLLTPKEIETLPYLGGVPEKPKDAAPVFAAPAAPAAAAPGAPAAPKRM